MREILFRGKRKDNEEWVEGYYCKIDERAMIAAIPVDCDTSKYMWSGYWLGPFYEVDPSTVCEYTGLTDKNCKKIFEGDIVSGFFNHEKITGKIFYGSDASFFIKRQGLYDIRLNNVSDWLEIGGNIHDNPELLERKT